MKISSRIVFWAVLSVVPLSLPACTSMEAGGGSSTTGRTTAGSDRRASRSANSAVSSAGGRAPATPAEPAAEAPAQPAPAEPKLNPDVARELDKLKPPVIVASTRPADGGTVTVNAMIGQVNGRPIYASTVLEPLEGQLKAWASTLPPREFRANAIKLVEGRLNQIIFDTLYLGEAERHLTEQERFGLKISLRLNREELVRRYGAGSEPRANEEMKKKTGRGLEETLTQIKETIVVRKFLDEVILPKITVSRRDVERYYFDPVNHAKYNPKAGRKIRLIRTTSSRHADEIDKQLKEGVAFTKVASERYNQYNNDGGGMMIVRDEKNKPVDFIQGDSVFGLEPLNEAMVKLKAGEYSNRITTGSAEKRDETHWWVYIEAIQDATHISLRDAQLEIEQQIKGMQYLMLEQRYRRKLYEDAGYTSDLTATNPLAVMNRALVDIAVNLFSKPS